MKFKRRDLLKNPIFKFFGSVRLTVVCLVLLFILVLWGTVDQVSNGLYHAQETFFHSFFFLAFGFLPFPGGQLVLWILFINLFCVTMTRFVFKWSHIGILVIHLGLLSYFVSAFITFLCVQESNLTLLEGASSNVPSAYHHWELSVWPESENSEKKVVAYDTEDLYLGQKLDYSEHELQGIVESYFPNSKALVGPAHPNEGILINDSGINSLTKEPVEKEPEKNMPGGIFKFTGTDRGDVSVLLYGGEIKPTKLVKNYKTYYVQLRRKRSVMPFSLKLKDFRMELHPNTEVARSYESLVEIDTSAGKRDVLISMNEPLRYKDYTLYQASYSIDQLGRQYSTLAVVKNFGRWFPYISSLITFLGLSIHFLTMAFKTKNQLAGN